MPNNVVAYSFPREVVRSNRIKPISSLDHGRAARPISFQPIETRIRELVGRLMGLGCGMTAVGSGYIIDEPDDEERRQAMNAILQEFGPRSHLVRDFSNYLRSIGHFIDVD